MGMMWILDSLLCHLCHRFFRIQRSQRRIVQLDHMNYNFLFLCFQLWNSGVCRRNSVRRLKMRLGTIEHKWELKQILRRIQYTTLSSKRRARAINSIITMGMLRHLYYNRRTKLICEFAIRQTCINLFLRLIYII